jgi:uncharacterized protein (TIGR00369 family)
MSETRTRAEIIRDLIPQSPFARHLGLELVSLGDGEAKLRMPFAAQLATLGDIVHGGAIATLMDTTGTVAAWATDEVPRDMRGATVGLTVSYAAAARGSDLVGTGRVVRRARSLCFCEIKVADRDRVIAHGTLIYSFG